MVKLGLQCQCCLLLEKVKKFEQELQKLDVTDLPDGACINLSNWLNLALSIPSFVDALELDSGILSLKIGGDGY